MNRPKKAFKLFLSSFDTANFTGTKSNAFYPISLNQLGLTNEDLDKSYKMTFMLHSALDAGFQVILNNTTLYFLSIILNNGSVQKKLYNTTIASPTGVLRLNNDLTSSYTRNITGLVSSTTASNKMSVSNVTGLVAGMSITVWGTGSIYGGTDFGGLINGTTYVIQSIAGFVLTLAGVSTLTTISGSMFFTASYQYNFPFFDTNATDNPPTYIDNLRGVNSVNLQLTTNAMNAYFSTTVNYACVLYFEEI